MLTRRAIVVRHAAWLVCLKSGTHLDGFTPYRGNPVLVAKMGSNLPASSSARVKSMRFWVRAYAERRPPRYRMTVSKYGANLFWMRVSDGCDT